MLRSEGRSVLKKSLTGPTLLEMSGKRVNQALGGQSAWFVEILAAFGFFGTGTTTAGSTG
jgi:hypothetical protein